ncbi:MAG: hypothetical protein ABIT47_01530 [Candidatus Paceibacterota bacterium]
MERNPTAEKIPQLWQERFDYAVNDLQSIAREIRETEIYLESVRAEIERAEKDITSYVQDDATFTDYTNLAREALSHGREAIDQKRKKHEKSLRTLRTHFKEVEEHVQELDKRRIRRLSDFENLKKEYAEETKR